MKARKRPIDLKCFRKTEELLDQIDSAIRTKGLSERKRTIMIHNFNLELLVYQSGRMNDEARTRCV